MKVFGEERQGEIRAGVFALGIRLAVYLASVVILALFGMFQENIRFSDFLEAWTKWDSPHYIDVAALGYRGAVENGEHLFLVFYPLFPWLLRLLHFLIADYRLCGVLLNLFCFSVGNVYFYRLARREYGEKAAEKACLCLVAFPFSFFYGAVLSESLFLMLSAMFLYYLRQHRWAAVAATGFFCCLTKNQGCFLAFAVLAELLGTAGGFSLLKNRRWKEFGKKILLPGLVCAMMVWGFVIYLGINYLVEGNPFRFLYYQKNHWYNSFCPIWQTVKYLAEYCFKGWRDLSVRFSIWIPDLALFFVWVAWILYGFRRKLCPALQTYLILLFFLTYSSTWLLSGGRYMLCALPGFLLTGEWASRHEKSGNFVLFLSVVLMTAYLAGFLCGKQIM